jgi:hypothetical protein
LCRKVYLFCLPAPLRSARDIDFCWLGEAGLQELLCESMQVLK